MRIISSKKQSAKRGNMSVRHLERLIADGEGPPIIRLGARKVGIADDDFDAWLASRRVVPPGWTAEADAAVAIGADRKGQRVGLIPELAHELEPRLGRRARLKLESVEQEVANA